MRTTTLLCALAAVVAAALPAAAYERVAIGDKDVVLGSITEAESLHEYLVDVPRNAVFSLSLPKQKDSRLQGSMGIFSTAYREQNALLIGKRKIQLAAPPTTSAQLRAIVLGVNQSTGNYVLKPRIKVQKKHVIRGKRSDLSPPGQIVFGALPGYDVDVKIAWSGPDPVTIGEFLAPDGSAVTSAEPGKQKRSTFRQRGFRTAQFGDHRVVLDIPSTAKSWTLLVTQKAKTQGRTLNLRPQQGMVPRLELGLAAAGVPVVIVKGESGGGNELLFTGGNTQPRPIGAIGATEACVLTALDFGPTPALWSVTCGLTHSALLTVGDRDANRRILDYTAFPVLTPGGSGRVELSDFAYDASNRLQGWTEARRFDTSGNEHLLVVSEIAIVGSATTFTVHHTDPDGATRRYDFIPLQ